jgi:hypothetical protein
LAGDNKAAQWKPVSAKTAAEMLEKEDNGDTKLPDHVRKRLLKRAGDKYVSPARKAEKAAKKRKKKEPNPVDRLKDETVEEYIARLHKLFGSK